MDFTVDLARAREACLASVDGFVDAVGSCSELELLASSRCRGWTRLDVVVHMVAGWQEMLGGLVSVDDAAPTIDAASYWRAFAVQEADDDPVRALMTQRRRTASYLRPASAVEQLQDVAAALSRGIAALDDRARLWQGHVFTAGDFLTTWAVENAVHHLDLQLDPHLATPPPLDALALTRETVEALLGDPLPTGWSDEQAALVGSGRVEPPSDAGPLAARLPVLG